MFTIDNIVVDDYDCIEYFGIFFSLPKGKAERTTHIATDYDGYVYGFMVEPIFDPITGMWDTDEDDPYIVRIPRLISKIAFTGHPKDSLQAYI